MLSALDDSVGNVTRALYQRDMLNNTIVIFSTDNGGPADGYDFNDASNWPLRLVLVLSHTHTYWHMYTPQRRDLSPVSTTRVDGPSWRAVNLGAFFDTRQLRPSTLVSKNAPEFTGRQLGPWTRVVETGLYWNNHWIFMRWMSFLPLSR